MTDFSGAFGFVETIHDLDFAAAEFRDRLERLPTSSLRAGKNIGFPAFKSLFKETRRRPSLSSAFGAQAIIRFRSESLISVGMPDDHQSCRFGSLFAFAGARVSFHKLSNDQG